MRVALTTRITNATDYNEPRDSLSHDWTRLLTQWNMAPFLIPNVIDDIASYLDILTPNLIVLTGGDDPGSTPQRDQIEINIMGYAIDRTIPVIGICRGMQMINGYYGGQLCNVEGHVNEDHAVKVSQAWLAYYPDEVMVNSFHGFGISELGLAAELTAIATDSSGNVEAFTHSHLPIAGIMWHPERPGAPAGDHALFKQLGI